MQHRSFPSPRTGSAAPRIASAAQESTSWLSGSGRHATDDAPTVRQGRHAAALPVDAIDGYVPSSFTRPSAVASADTASAATRRTTRRDAVRPTVETGMAALAARPRTAAGAHSAFRRPTSPTPWSAAGSAVSRRVQHAPDRRIKQQRTAATYAVAVLGAVTTGAILLPGQQAAAGTVVGPASAPTPTTRALSAPPSLADGQVLLSCRPIAAPVRRHVGPVVRPTTGATPAPSQPARTAAGLTSAPRVQSTPAPTETPQPVRRDPGEQLHRHRRITPPTPVASLGPAPTESASASPSASAVPTATPTIGASDGPATPTPAPTRTSAPRPAPTHTATPRPMPTHTAEPTPTPTRTAEPIPAAPLRTLVRRASSSTLRLGSGAFRFSNFADDLLGVSLGGPGIHGDGTDRTILEMTPHSSTKGSHASRAKGSTNQLSLMRISGSPTLSDFTLLGTKQGHLYNGLRLSKTHDARLTNVRVSAIPGDDHVNPGETFGINDFRTSGTVYDGVEVDGAGVGATGIGTNMSQNVTILDSYLHDNPHSAGAAFWETHDITLRHVISTDNKTGLNFERTSGSVRIEQPVFRGNRVDLHIGSDRGSTRYTIVDPQYSGSKLRIMLQPHYMGSHNDQKRSDIRVLVHGVDRTDQVVQWVG